jgi:hypothetical protein
LQLSSLLEKTGRKSQPQPLTNDLFGSDSQLIVPDPPGSNRVGSEAFRFIVSPRDISAAMRLNFEAERQFRQCVAEVLGKPCDAPLIRSRNATILPVGAVAYDEQRFGLSAKGGMGFISKPGVMTNEGLFFIPIDFCQFLLQFLTVASLFYETMMRFYGSYELSVETVISQAKLFPGSPALKNRLAGAELFEPPLETIRASTVVQIEVALHPISRSRLQDYLEAVLTEIGRSNGSVLNADFRTAMQAVVDEGVKRFNSVRAARST